MKSYKKLIGIHGVPRSGTSWLGQIINSCQTVNFKFQPLFSYEFKDRLHPKSNATEITQFFNDIFSSDNYFLNLRDPDLHKNYPSFNKVASPDILVYKHVRYHNLLKNLMALHEPLEVICVLRNPLAVLSSWKKAPREFKREWDFEKEWRRADKKNQGREEEFFGYERWKEASLLFLQLSQQYPNRVSLIRYDELIANPVEQITDLFKERGLEMEQQTIDFIQKSTQRSDDDPNSVFRSKSKDDAYKNAIPKQIIEAVYQDLEGTILENYL